MYAHSICRFQQVLNSRIVRILREKCFIHMRQIRSFQFYYSAGKELDYKSVAKAFYVTSIQQEYFWYSRRSLLFALSIFREDVGADFAFSTFFLCGYKNLQKWKCYRGPTIDIRNCCIQILLGLWKEFGFIPLYRPSNPSCALMSASRHEFLEIQFLKAAFNERDFSNPFLH